MSIIGAENEQNIFMLSSTLSCTERISLFVLLSRTPLSAECKQMSPARRHLMHPLSSASSQLRKLMGNGPLPEGTRQTSATVGSASPEAKSFHILSLSFSNFFRGANIKFAEDRWTPPRHIMAYVYRICCEWLTTSIVKQASLQLQQLSHQFNGCYWM